MSGFKLLAIRPLEGCNKELLKVLKENQLYQFYNSYEFIFEDNNKSGKVLEVVPSNNYIDTLYDIRWENEKNELQKELPVAVSAIVGKNGAGKSSLLELIYAAIYQMSLYADILVFNEDIEQKWISKEEFEKLDDEEKKLKGIANLKIQLFFEIGAHQIELTINGAASVARDHLTENPLEFRLISNTNLFEEREFKLDQLLSNTKEFIQKYFFYTIAVNYSAYSLNSLQIGKWLDYVVHKNDGYQTPLVLNPKRTKGNININIENDLVAQRLSSNVLEPIGKNLPEKSLRNMAPNKTVSEIELTIDWEKINGLKVDEKVTNFEILLETLYLAYTGSSYSSRKVNNKLLTLEFYLLNKIIKVCRVYTPYNKYYEGTSFQVEELVKKLMADESHITFKIRQALNWLHFDHIPKVHDNLNKTFDFPIDELALNIERIIKQNPKRNLKTIELIPPSFFETRLKFNGNGYFDELSSGEKQKIYSTSTIVYHIINLNSVFNNKTDNISPGLDNKYHNINVLFDEAELYFHPEYQRRYINDLISYIGLINIDNIKHLNGVNICFATHSPFILSDIPSSNILRLKDGDSKPEEGQTFGANIHQLLHNDFYLENGFIGEFAKSKIEEVVDFLREKKWNHEEKMIGKLVNSEISDDIKTDLNIQLKIIALQKSRVKQINTSLDTEKCRAIINLVGEPLLSESLNQLLSEVEDLNQKEI